MSGPKPDYEHLALKAGRVFSPAAPIDDEALFAGRVDQLRAIVDAVGRRGQHAVIYGERGVGKTSLANVLRTLGESLASQRALLVNCDGTDDFASAWRKVFGRVEWGEERAGLGFGAPTVETTTSLADRLPERITPETVMLALTEIARLGGVTVVMDEFDRMPGAQTSLFADTIKALSDRAVDATVVLVGVADSVDQLIEEHQSVERALAQIQMPRMSAEELHEIVTRGLDRLDMRIDPAALGRISRLSHGLPHYAHLLGIHAARAALDRKTVEVAEDDVNEAVEKALAEAQQSIRAMYGQATASPRRESLFKQVLLASALARTDEAGFFSPADVRGPMTGIMGKTYDIPSFSRHLNEFVDARRGPVLQRRGGERRYRYRFVNPLLQPYVTMRGVEEGLIDLDMLDDPGR